MHPLQYGNNQSSHQFFPEEERIPNYHPSYNNYPDWRGNNQENYVEDHFQRCEPPCERNIQQRPRYPIHRRDLEDNRRRVVRRRHHLDDVYWPNYDEDESPPRRRPPIWIRGRGYRRRGIRKSDNNRTSYNYNNNNHIETLNSKTSNKPSIVEEEKTTVDDSCSTKEQNVEERKPVGCVGTEIESDAETICLDENKETVIDTLSTEDISLSLSETTIIETELPPDIIANEVLIVDESIPTSLENNEQILQINSNSSNAEDEQLTKESICTEQKRQEETIVPFVNNNNKSDLPIESSKNNCHNIEHSDYVEIDKNSSLSDPRNYTELNKFPKEFKLIKNYPEVMDDHKTSKIHKTKNRGAECTTHKNDDVSKNKLLKRQKQVEKKIERDPSKFKQPDKKVYVMKSPVEKNNDTIQNTTEEAKEFKTCEIRKEKNVQKISSPKAMSMLREDFNPKENCTQISNFKRNVINDRKALKDINNDKTVTTTRQDPEQSESTEKTKESDEKNTVTKSETTNDIDDIKLKTCFVRLNKIDCEIQEGTTTKVENVDLFESIDTNRSYLPSCGDKRRKFRMYDSDDEVEYVGECNNNALQQKRREDDEELLFLAKVVKDHSPATTIDGEENPQRVAQRNFAEMARKRLYEAHDDVSICTNFAKVPSRVKRVVRRRQSSALIESCSKEKTKQGQKLTELFGDDLSDLSQEERQIINNKVPKQKEDNIVAIKPKKICRRRYTDVGIPSNATTVTTDPNKSCLPEDSIFTSKDRCDNITPNGEKSLPNGIPLISEVIASSNVLHLKETEAVLDTTDDIRKILDESQIRIIESDVKIKADNNIGRRGQRTRSFNNNAEDASDNNRAKVIVKRRKTTLTVDEEQRDVTYEESLKRRKIASSTFYALPDVLSGNQFEKTQSLRTVKPEKAKKLKAILVKEHAEVATAITQGTENVKVIQPFIDLTVDDGDDIVMSHQEVEMTGVSSVRIENIKTESENDFIEEEPTILSTAVPDDASNTPCHMDPSILSNETNINVQDETPTEEKEMIINVRVVNDVKTETTSSDKQISIDSQLKYPNVVKLEDEEYETVDEFPVKSPEKSVANVSLCEKPCLENAEVSSTVFLQESPSIVRIATIKVSRTHPPPETPADTMQILLNSSGHEMLSVFREERAELSSHSYDVVPSVAREKRVEEASSKTHIETRAKNISNSTGISLAEQNCRNENAANKKRLFAEFCVEAAEIIGEYIVFHQAYRVSFSTLQGALSKAGCPLTKVNEEREFLRSRIIQKQFFYSWCLLEATRKLPNDFSDFDIQTFSSVVFSHLAKMEFTGNKVVMTEFIMNLLTHHVNEYGKCLNSRIFRNQIKDLYLYLERNNRADKSTINFTRKQLDTLKMQIKTYHQLMKQQISINNRLQPLEPVSAKRPVHNNNLQLSNRPTTSQNNFRCPSVLTNNANASTVPVTIAHTGTFASARNPQIINRGQPQNHLQMPSMRPLSQLQNMAPQVFGRNSYADPSTVSSHHYKVTLRPPTLVKINQSPVIDDVGAGVPRPSYEPGSPGNNNMLHPSKPVHVSSNHIPQGTRIDKSSSSERGTFQSNVVDTNNANNNNNPGKDITLRSLLSSSYSAQVIPSVEASIRHEQQPDLNTIDLTGPEIDVKEEGVIEYQHVEDGCIDLTWVDDDPDFVKRECDQDEFLMKIEVDEEPLPLSPGDSGIESPPIQVSAASAYDYGSQSVRVEEEDFPDYFSYIV